MQNIKTIIDLLDKGRELKEIGDICQIQKGFSFEEKNIENLNFQ